MECFSSIFFKKKEMDAQCPCIYCIAKVNYLFRKYPFCKLEYLEAAFRDKGWHPKCGDACVQRF